MQTDRTFVDKFDIMRTLKDAPITILFTMFLARRPVSQTWLSNTLDYDRKTIRKHLRFLNRAGYIERDNYRKWRLPAGQLRLPGFPPILAAPKNPELAAPNERGTVPQLHNSNHSDNPERGTVPQLHNSENPERGTIPLSDDFGAAERGTIPLSVRTYMYSISNSPKSKYVCSTDAERGTIPLSEPERGTIPLSDDLRDAFQEAGINPPIWEELAQLSWVTPSYIRAIAAKVNQDPDQRKHNTGFLVHCIRSHDPPPEICAECGGVDGHYMSCSTHRRRYVEGKYGDIIQS